MIITFISGLTLGILLTLAVRYIYEILHEYMFMKYHNEPPSPEQIMEVREALIGHRGEPPGYDKEGEFVDERTNSYQ